MRSVGGLVESLRRGELVEQQFNNPYLEEGAQLQEILFTSMELNKNKGEVFSDSSKPLIVEIGSYFGKNLIEMAVNHPENNFFGLEITYKRVVRCARKIKKDNLVNARVGIMDARAFFPVIKDNSLDGICIFFPDPWPKKKKAKNRLLQKEFIKLLECKLKPSGFVWLKTDQEFYFSEAQANFKECGWFLSEPNTQPEELSDSPYFTAFEELFTKQGLLPFKQFYRNSKGI